MTTPMKNRARDLRATLLALALAIAGFALAFGLGGCATAGQPITLPAPPLVRY